MTSNITRGGLVKKLRNGNLNIGQVSLEEMYRLFPELANLSRVEAEFCIMLPKGASKKVKRYLEMSSTFCPDQLSVFINYIDSNKGARGLYYRKEYWMSLLGCDELKGLYLVNKLKQDKVTSKSGFIRRHGEVAGLIAFHKFQETSAIATEVKIASGFNYRAHTPRCVEYWVKNKNCSLEEAKDRVSVFQLENSGVSRGYYEKLKYSEEEIDLIMEGINKRKNIYDDEMVKQRYGVGDVEAQEIKKSFITKMVGSMTERGQCSPLEERAAWSHYQHRVRNISKGVDVSRFSNVDKRGKGTLDYNIDHKYSVLRCFLDRVPEYIAGSVYNLQCITRKENLEKAHKCSISLYELYYTYFKSEMELSFDDFDL